VAITYKSQGAGGGTEVQATQLGLACPATVDANDVLIAHLNATALAWSPTGPGGGWELLYGPANMGTGTAVGRSWVYGKLAAGTEDGATVNFGVGVSTEGRWGRIYSFAGYVSGALTDVVPAASFTDTPTETSIPLPTVTTSEAGALAVALLAQDDNNAFAAAGAVTGGTWAEPVAEFVSTTLGPQGVICGIQTCTPTADPGTVTGGTANATADEGSTIGFEIRDSALPTGSYEIHTRTTAGSSGTSHAVLLPDGSNVSGRLVWVIFSAENTVTWPSGWTEFFAGSTTSTVLRAAYRFIDGTEGFDGTDDSITVTTSSAVLSNAHAYLSKSGHHASTAPEAATAATGSGANANSPTFDPAGWASEETLWVPAAAYRFGANFTGAPTNYTGLLSLNGGDSNAPLGSARRALTASSEDPGTFTSDDGGAWVSTTIAIRPAAAGGGPVALDGTGEMVVEADGDLAVARPLAGSAEVVLEGDGQLTVTGAVVALDGTTGIIVEVFALSASLRVARAIDGQAEVVVGASGNLVVAQALTGQTVVVVESDGELTVTAGGSVVALDGTAEIVLGDAAVLAMVVGLDGQTEVAIDTGTAELGVPQSVALEGQAEIVFDTADSNFRWRPETGGQRRRGWPRYANRRPGWG
jgi:hypothetical protein